MTMRKGKMTYGVWCKVSGGVTGTREAWLKNADRKIKSFATYEEAQAEAARLMANVSCYSRATFSYMARRLCEVDFLLSCLEA